MSKDSSFKKQIAFNYKQLEGVERFKGAQLAQMGATQLMEFKLKSTAQQQAEIINKHKMGMSRLKVLTEHGQIEAAMYQAKAMGMPWATDIKAFWKSRLKDASIDNKDAIAAFEKAGYSSSLGNLKSGMNEYLNAKFPNPRMLSSNNETNGQIRYLSRFHDLHIEPMVRYFFQFKY